MARIDSRGPWPAVNRWLGRDDNPLRRESDRREARARRVVVMLSAAILPLAFLLGFAAFRGATDDSSGVHPVTATVTATGVSVSSGLAVIHTGTVAWVAPDGVRHQATVVLTRSERVGEAVRLWVDRQDRVGARPTTTTDAVVNATLVALLSQLTVVLILAAGLWAVRARLDPRRFQEWDEDWRRLDRFGSGHGSPS
jgi:hypothetical protein